MKAIPGTIWNRIWPSQTTKSTTSLLCQQQNHNMICILLHIKCLHKHVLTVLESSIQNQPLTGTFMPPMTCNRRMKWLIVDWELIYLHCSQGLILILFFPEIDFKKLVFCVLHGGARVDENILNVELESILCRSNKTSEINSLSTEDIVRNLENNIRACGVKGGNFKIELNDKAKQAEAIKLNKDDAFSIIFPSIPGQNDHPHVLHNVLSSESQIPLKFPLSVIDHLKLSQSLSNLEYVSLMWSSFYSMFSIACFWGTSYQPSVGLHRWPEETVYFPYREILSVV